ncbi:phospholipase D-like protein [Phytophthora sojae]|uniref:phospholipase D n=1 Tax=Phytophthora sojae (strain P6497) TaxID=1094619 RepID=G4YYR6_PHYSP|nr:phospholipase D-like protein [Phytophthora sojae]EGZ25744.1 phospholipase D-like protein [Phytophthora sojae]|eukprot:XP_009521032.1 phospholipase D-like protein [Phytophthora sojae]
MKSVLVLIALANALVTAPTSVSAFSFSSLFDSGDSKSSGNSTAGQSDKAATGSEDADLSDGTDIKPRQPLLDPEDGFLTEQEITDSRGGIPRDDMSVYTTGNKVTSYTVANEFYDAVYEDLSTTKEGDRVLLAAWLAALVPLKPDVDPTGKKTGVKEVFAGVVERGGSVNILNWANIGVGYTPHNIKARDAINSIPPSPINGNKAVLIFDDRLPKALASHHQKNMVIAANSSTDPDDQPVAYVGGLDLANDRWDTIYHNNTEIRDRGKITFREKGWMDGHIRIHGPAAKDVANNFVARWNSDYLPCQGLDDDLLDFKNPKYESIAPLDYASSNTTASLGKQSVQITRTFSCLYEHYKEFAPRGETSLFQARIKAIKNAKNFIYIEDQYFVLVPELLDAIMEVMPKIQRLVVIANPQTSPFTNAGYIKYFYESVEPIRSKYPNKFKVYTTKAERDILIHTKLVIIDDVYLSIGSANWNRRSMTSDSELNADVVDGETVKSPEGVTVGKLPRNFRIRKFQEMTGLSYKKLNAMTFVEAADQLPIAVADESSILDNNNIQHKAYFVVIMNSMRKVSDPQEESCTYSGSGSTKETE